MNNSDWFVCPQPRFEARTRLFCFPYAGGTVAQFRDWPQLIGSEIEVWIAYLPGRGTRMQEPAYKRIRPLIAELKTAIEPLCQQPFAFFGHSFGARLAFELTNSLRDAGLAVPRHLFLSACPAPQLSPRTQRLHTLPRDQLLAELRKRGGVPTDVLAQPVLLDALLPALRSDLAVLETAVYQSQQPLDIPITTFGGTADLVVQAAELDAWRIHAKSDFRVQMFVGDHFFLGTAVVELTRAIRNELSSL